MDIERRYQVFISSTYVDLVEERREVIQALLELDCIPAGMELFPAANAEQWELIQEVIDDCDYYLVVVGGRYGSVTAEGVSYTEKEYDYAVSRGLPVIGFVHENPSDIPAGKSELDSEARDKLDTFRAKVQGKMVKYYANPADLGGKVSRALHQLMKKEPREGWVRGRHAMTAEVEARISDLKAQVAELKMERMEAGELDRSQFDLEELAQGTEVVRMNLVFRITDRRHKVNPYTRWIDVTWDQILRGIGPLLMHEASEPDIEQKLAVHLGRLEMPELIDDVENDPDYYLPDGVYVHNVEERTAYRLEPGEWDKVKVQLAVLGLIERGAKKRTVSDKATYWKLSREGERRLMYLSAIRKSQIAEATD